MTREAPMTLGSLVRARRDEADLLWFFSGESRGDMGERSGFPAMVARLECGGRTGGRPVMDLDERCLAAAERERPIRRAIEVLWRRAPELVQVLHAAYSPSPTQAPHVATAWGRLATLVPMTLAAQSAWARSGTDRDLGEWLVRLAWRASRQPVSPADRVLVVSLRREADALRSAALAAYSTARPRRPTMTRMSHQL